MKIIVTGGAGFIGGQTCLKLLDQGHEVMSIDRVLPPEHLLKFNVHWYTSDFASDESLEAIKQFCPDAIVHCAGTSLVGPSLLNPREYYDNNFVKTKKLLDYIIDNNISLRFIFSSSAATYGNPVMSPCQEVDPAEPISPYGESKLMIEWLLRSYSHAYGLDYVAFRYFNACGADSQGRHGQPPGGTHIIARILESVTSNNRFVLNGNTFDTSDGTCIRDYIHVEDLADAHIVGAESCIPAGVYNLGTSTGTSNLEVLSTASLVVQSNIPYDVGPMRPGDPVQLTADAGKFTNASNWKPQFNLYDMISHAWIWYTR